MRTSRLLLTAGIVVLAACSDSPFSPSPLTVERQSAQLRAGVDASGTWVNSDGSIGWDGYTAKVTPRAVRATGSVAFSRAADRSEGRLFNLRGPDFRALTYLRADGTTFLVVNASGHLEISALTEAGDVYRYQKRPADAKIRVPSRKSSFALENPAGRRFDFAGRNAFMTDSAGAVAACEQELFAAGEEDTSICTMTEEEYADWLDGQGGDIGFSLDWEYMMAEGGTESETDCCKNELHDYRVAVTGASVASASAAAACVLGAGRAGCRIGAIYSGYAIHEMYDAKDDLNWCISTYGGNRYNCGLITIFALPYFRRRRKIGFNTMEL
jgi:hypothetical protein